MLESVAERLCDPGGPHHGCPDKHPRFAESIRGGRALRTVHAAAS